MMLLWMSYSVVASVCLALAALVVEQAARRWSLPSRWIWAGSLTASILISLAAWGAPPAALGSMLATSARVDRQLLAAWLIASASGAVVMLLSLENLRLRRKRWSLARVDGMDALVTDGFGPAVVGYLHPIVALPKWVFRAPSEQRRMLIAREEEHLFAGDFRLMGVAMLVVVAAMPWNLALWLHVNRLRAAIDVDCRARVLNRILDQEEVAIPQIEVPARRPRSYAPTGPVAEAASYLDWRSPSLTSHSAQRAD